MTRAKRGFTLIELLVVIAIIGILATLVITQLGSARNKARVATAKSDVSEAGKAIELFKADETSGDGVIKVGSTNGLTLNSAGNADPSIAQTNNMSSVFTGTMSIASRTYGVNLTKTPTSGMIYRYHDKNDGGGMGNGIDAGAANNTYFFSADLSTAIAGLTGDARYVTYFQGSISSVDPTGIAGLTIQ